MTRSQSAAASRRRIRSELRNLRSNSGQTQRQVAEALDWSPTKLMRIEGGRVGISTTDLKALLAHYDVDAEAITRLVQVAKDSRKPTLAKTYSAVLTKEFAEFLDNEEAASGIRQFESKLIPGLLQTEEYAQAAITAHANASDSDEIISQRVAARLARREQLFQDDGPEAVFILDEAALWRRIGAEVGDDSLMIRQLEDLLDASKFPNVKIQILPFSSGAYPSMRGPFVILDFADPSENDLLYLENPEGSMIYTDNTEKTVQFTDAFEQMLKMSTPPERLAEIVEKFLDIHRSSDFKLGL